MTISPQVLLDRLAALFPDFRLRWDDPMNLFREDDGSFTRCGAFAEFSHYFREGYRELPSCRVAALGVFISDCVASEDSELADATLSCFLENVGGEWFSRDFQQHLFGNALRFYREWDLPG